MSRFGVMTHLKKPTTRKLEPWSNCLSLPSAFGVTWLDLGSRFLEPARKLVRLPTNLGQKKNKK